MTRENDLKIDIFYKTGVRYGGMNKNDWIDVAERLFKENISLKKRLRLARAKTSKEGV